MRGPAGRVRKCLACALHDRRMLRRSFLTALVVGTILTLINHGPDLFAGDFSSDLAWKIPLTYLVPFCVTSWGALANAYLRHRPALALLPRPLSDAVAAPTAPGRRSSATTENTRPLNPPPWTPFERDDQKNAAAPIAPGTPPLRDYLKVHWALVRPAPNRRP